MEEWEVTILIILGIVIIILFILTITMYCIWRIKLKRKEEKNYNFKMFESYLSSKKDIISRDGNFDIPHNFIKNFTYNELLEFTVLLESKHGLSLKGSKNFEGKYELISLNNSDTIRIE